MVSSVPSSLLFSPKFLDSGARGLRALPKEQWSRRTRRFREGDTRKFLAWASALGPLVRACVKDLGWIGLGGKAKPSTVTPSRSR